MSAYRRLLQRIGHARWFAAFMRSVGAPADRALYMATRGRLSSSGPRGFPQLLLTTTGRRSGRPRTTPLFYVRDGERLVVTSESFGQRRPAGWPLNLEANPETVVQLGAVRRPYRGRRASDSEADRYWPAFLETWPAHATYRERSGVRKTFILEPALQERVPPADP
jgi:deazaflavin-dependent oxidoreductase (nitroreductase family)